MKTPIANYLSRSQSRRCCCGWWSSRDDDGCGGSDVVVDVGSKRKS